MTSKKRNGQLTLQCEQLFRYVLQTYFPRSNKARTWQLEIVDPDHPALSGAHGKCVPESKTVFITPIPSNYVTSLESLMVHEVTHIVASKYHGKTFLSRLEKAALKARAIGKPIVSNQLLREIERYSEVTKTM